MTVYTKNNPAQSEFYFILTDNLFNHKLNLSTENKNDLKTHKPVI